ncbi:MAG: class D sortase [Oscillospiraceae bacterium]
MERRSNGGKGFSRATALLLLLTVLSAGMIAGGIVQLREVTALTRAGLEVTEQFLHTPAVTVPPSGDPAPAPAAPSPSAPPETMVGDGIITVFTAEESRYAVYDGVTQEHLSLGTARASDSALPGRTGNCVIYGHRDSVFRCLQEVALGDKIALTTADGTFTYTAAETAICTPTDQCITQTYDDPRLTLVTCYPFVYSGPARQRYLVVCTLDGEAAEQSG